ncbi:MAG: hypothetical protein JW862_17025 [Anaerolineales bacterium]|nr:hypothetical protein [Anaerolineales bacterium]
MERTVPHTASEEVELYLRTYYSLLRSTAPVQIRTLEEVHSGMKSLLHPGVRQQAPDLSAFIYGMLRLPDCIHGVRLVVLGQSVDVFRRGGFPQVSDWEVVTARARRRRCFYNRQDTMACIIASRSDIDDVIPMLAAYQLEWNKLHDLMRFLPAGLDLSAVEHDRQTFSALASHLKMEIEELQRFQTLWGADFTPMLQRIAERQQDFQVQLLSGSLSEYRRATHAWWANVADHVPEISARPVYFVSSNTHSLVNLISGFALDQRQELLAFLSDSQDEELIEEWHAIQTAQTRSNQENFLYYVLKKYLQTPAGKSLNAARRTYEQESGITRVDSRFSFEVDAQVIELNRLRPERMDPRLCENGLSFLADSDALILNIDYPLGLAAYNILSDVAEHVGQILGVYILGKAASLNGVIGDVIIPNVVHDEHSRNTFIFPAAFAAADVAPHLVYGTVLDNQKAVTVLGTFLQNATYMDVFYREGYTDIEMEAGPYLSAVYEMYRPKRHPVDEIVNLYNLPFDLGILHYVSDTPLSKGQNLGAGTLSYFGMDPTYATSIAILRRIIRLERQRIT